MKEIRRIFAQRRNEMRRVAHAYGGKFTNVTEGVGFTEIFKHNVHNLMEPILDSMKVHNRGWFTDIFHDYDELKDIVATLEDESVLFYAIGIRECGTDSPTFIEAMVEGQGDRALLRYEEVFFFVASIDNEAWLGKNAKAIDVYRLHINAE